MTDLHVTELGEGTRAVLVHGSMSDGEDAWGAQRSLADQGYQLLLPDRRGYGRSPRAGGEDYERDAADIAWLLGGGAHLVGHSYGALSALWAAALRPEAVLSLTVVEPPAFGLVGQDPAVKAYMDEFKAVWAAEELSDREFLVEFMLAMGLPREMVSSEDLDTWTPVVPALRHCRPLWDASVPVEVLNSVLFPKLVVSGRHHPAFDAVTSELTQAMGARCVELPGAGHMVQMLGEPFNAELLAFWRAAEASAAAVSA